MTPDRVARRRTAAGWARPTGLHGQRSFGDDQAGSTDADALPSSASHLSSDIAAAARAEATERLRQLMQERQTLRSREEVASFFTGPDMVEPGLVRIPEWRPDNENDAKSPSALWGGVARKR